MAPRPDKQPPVSQRRASSLAGLQPIDTSPFRRPSSLFMVWFSILVVWLISLLPWREWQPAPDLLLLVIAFWCVNEPRRVSMLAAFVLGLLMDVHAGTLLGGQALVYTLAAYGATALQRRLQHFNAVIQAMHMLPVFVLAQFIGRVIYAWLTGQWAGWAWLWSALFMAVLWPLVDLLLHMPQRRLDDADAGSV